MMAISNPLIKRGLTVRIGYIWGQGVEVTARVGQEAEAEKTTQQTQGRQRRHRRTSRRQQQTSLTGSQARRSSSGHSAPTASVFLAMFTAADRPGAGPVDPVDEITDIITTPRTATSRGSTSASTPSPGLLEARARGQHPAARAAGKVDPPGARLPARSGPGRGTSTAPRSDVGRPDPARAGQPARRLAARDPRRVRLGRVGPDVPRLPGRLGRADQGAVEDRVEGHRRHQVAGRAPRPRRRATSSRPGRSLPPARSAGRRHRGHRARATPSRRCRSPGPRSTPSPGSRWRRWSPPARLPVTCCWPTPVSPAPGRPPRPWTRRPSSRWGCGGCCGSR
jgi:hypothetical protein